VAHQGEAGASVHLSFDHLGLGVDAFGASVVVWEGDAAVAAWRSRSRPRVNECTWGRSAARAPVIHWRSLASLPGSGTLSAVIRTVLTCRNGLPKLDPEPAKRASRGRRIELPAPQDGLF
jgi:hypothetical protein